MYLVFIAFISIETPFHYPTLFSCIDYEEIHMFYYTGGKRSRDD